MYRPLDRKLHFNQRQDTGEYFGKDCGKYSLPSGQGRSTGTIGTADDVYPCIIPYKNRQATDLNKEYYPPKKGERPMHATTITYVPVKPLFTSVTHHEYGGRPDVRPARRPHSCRSMHTSQIVLGVDQRSHRQSTYSSTYYDKYSQPNYEVLAPVLRHKNTSVNSKEVKDSMRSQSHTNYLSQYGVSHNKLGAMLDISKPKHEIPKPRDLPHHYNVLTGEDIGPSWQSDNKRTSGNRILYSALQRENSFVLC